MTTLTATVARLAGKVALITGGASGIGKACACRFAREGAQVIVADIRDSVATVAQISREGGHGRCEFHDVADESSWVRLIAAVRSLYLASDEARYVTGAELVVDGGLSVA